MAGKRREEAKRTQAIEAAAENQGEILSRLRAIESKLDDLIAAATAPPPSEPTPPKSKGKTSYHGPNPRTG